MVQRVRLATYWDIPYLYFEWFKVPEVTSMVLSNLGLGFLFAALGVWSIFKEMFKELKSITDDVDESHADLDSVLSTSVSDSKDIEEGREY